MCFNTSLNNFRFMYDTNFINGLLNPKLDQPAAKGGMSTNEYRPSPKDGKNGVYDAIIRFVPWIGNPSKSIMQKLQAWVKNPVTKNGMYVDDPRSGGQSESPVNQMYWSLINTNNAKFEELAKECLSTRNVYASLVQIINDAQHPELNNKILVFKFGKKIYEKLMAEQTPPIAGMVARNPFDPIHGRFFALKVVYQSNFNNYDQSSFFDYTGQAGDTSGIRYQNAAGQWEVLTDSSDKQYFAEWLAKTSPDLAPYDFQPWSAAVQQHVDETLRIIGNCVQTGTLPSGPAFGQAISAASSSAPQGIQFGGFGQQQPTPGIQFGGSQSQQPAQSAQPVQPQVNSGISAPQFGAPAQGGVNPAAPTVTGIELPDVASALPHVEPINGANAPIFGDLSSVLANM